MKSLSYPLLATILTAVLVTGLGCDLAGQSGDDYTIALQRFNDRYTHVEQANAYQKQAAQLTGWDVNVIHEADASIVHWGSYGSLDAAGKGLEKARTASANGQPLFPMAMVIPMPGPPPGPAEWNLANVKDPNAFYTLLVAVEYNDPEAGQYGYKNNMVDITRKLREMGYEAYYYVEGEKGLVCVGTFPESALKAEQQAVRNPDTGEFMMWQEVKVIADPKLRQLHDVDFPELVVNGYGEIRIIRDPKTGKVIKEVKQTSLPYRIPGRQSSRVLR